MSDQQLLFEANADALESRAVFPLTELGAYEALWDEPNASFKRLAKKFARGAGLGQRLRDLEREARPFA